MKRILILILIFLLLDSDNSIKNTVDANDFIDYYQSMTVSTLFSYIEVDDYQTIDNDNNECACDKNTGLISYDGGASKTKCQCSLGGEPCGCVNCDSQSTSFVEQPVVNLNDYYLMKFTASWCGPCKIWNDTKLSEFENAGIEVVEIDYDNNRKLVDNLNIKEVPSFFICTKADRIDIPNDLKYPKINNDYHVRHVYDANDIGIGAEYSFSQCIKSINKIDKIIHPNKDNGIYYERQQNLITPLNGKVFAEKEEYISHFKSDNHKKLNNIPFNKFSTYELKAMHDDDHAGKLGIIHGI